MATANNSAASLLLDSRNQNNSELFLPKFEKANINIKFEPNEKLPYFDETKEIQKTIINTANSLLYHWKNVTIVFPPSLTGLCDDITHQNIDKNFKNNKLQINNLFILPSFNELDEIATDSSGKTKKLNKEQLSSIKKYGEFDVPSAHFPGQTHKWRLAKWLQLGYIRSNELFFKSLATALRLIIITAKNRIVSDTFSMKAAVISIFKGSRRALDMLIGLSAMKVVPYEEKLVEEEKNFLVAELTVDPKEKTKHEQFVKTLNDAINRKEDMPVGRIVFDIPYYYRTPDNILIDLRLFDQELMDKVLPILEELLKQSDDDHKWFSGLRRKLIGKFKNEGLSDSEIVEQTSNLIKKEYTDRIFERVINNNAINQLSPHLGITLVNHAQSILIMEQAVEKARKEIETHVEEYEKSLKAKHKVKSQISTWLYDCCSKERERFTKLHEYRAHELAIEECTKNDLKQTAYFLNRELMFRRENEPALRNEMEKRKVPTREYTFYRKIWSPKNWIVTKHVRGQEPEVIKPNVFVDSFNPERYSNTNNNLHYTLDRNVKYTNSTRLPFWRWTNFFIRTWVYFCNSLFFFGIIIPFYSPVSFSALFRCKVFYPDKEINSRTGQIHVKERSKTHTFTSRIVAIWRHVTAARARFESQPDKGLIGKAFQRFFNRIWNYVFKGFVGTLGVVTLFPPLCLLVSLGSLTLAILTPIWYPILNLFLHIAYGLIFDWDNPVRDSKFNRLMVYVRIVLWNYLICGVFQGAASLLTAFGILPATSLIITIYSCVGKIMRSTWDNLMFYTVLKPRAKVPSHDTFVARRFAGPGLASNYFYQINIEQALAALEARIEKDVLDAYLSHVTSIINEPETNYNNFFNTLLKPFSYTVTSGTNSFTDLKGENDSILKKFRDVIDKRKSLLSESISKSDLSKIRLKDEDLKLVILKSTEILKTHYQKYILPYQRKTVTALFREYDLDDDDWTTFTGIYLENLFGEGFLTPLENTDTVFQLDVNHLNLHKYSSMIANSELRDDLDLVMARYNPKSGHLVIPMPTADTSMYTSTDSNWSRDNKLYIPTRLPSHPGIISILLFNRDNQGNKIKFSSYKQIHEIITRNYKKQNNYSDLI